jgi:acyl-CoA reductase-like NAD-dependent aldehyde dehydrogenase
MRQNVDTLAELESRNTGIPITQSRFEVESAARHLEYFAGFAGKIEGMSADLRGWLASTQGHLQLGRVRGWAPQRTRSLDRRQPPHWPPDD